MSWTTPADLQAQLARLWERGELARAVVAGEGALPLRLVLKGPSSAELADRFDAVRTWAAELAAMPHVRIEWREVRHRVHGLQRLPQQAWVGSLDDALALLGKRRDAERLARLVALTRASAPALLSWLARRPLQAIELADRWPQLLAVVQWLAAHPRPAIYLRQVDVTGVHSKFIEAHRGVLAELFDLALPPHALCADAAGTSQFAARYGFLDKPARIRLRVLDERIRLLPGVAALPDVTLDAASFASMQIDVQRVFITENETNFLAFPPAPHAIVVFGAGYGWDALAAATWLQRCPIHYWGDIDTHGFAILDQLRARFGHVQSFLMDRATLLAHEAQWGEEPAQVLHDLPRLTSEERALFDDLRDNSIRANLRLEQERIGFAWVMRAIA
jgi:hypothetical protein